MKIDRQWIEFAEHLAEVAGGVIRPYFRGGCSAKFKRDLSPVTAADEEAEAAIRAEIKRRFPDHAILGEEGGHEGEGAAWTWVIDPIDGTKAFLAGIPLFTTLIALCHEDEPVLGVIDQPILRERWVGVAGEATRMNGKQTRASSCESLSRARLSTTSPFLFREEDQPRFRALSRACASTIYGGDAYAYAMVASGHLDLVIESGLKSHDFAALLPVLQGAGACVTDWRGEALTLHSGGDIIAAATPALAKAAQTAL